MKRARNTPFADPLTTNFPLSVRNQLQNITNEDDRLKYHQFIVREYFIKSGQRGLLICHGMGYGKTRIAVSIALHYSELEPSRRIIILSAKSLSENFKKEVQKFDPNDKYLPKFKFISLNASNMFKQIMRKSDEERDLEERLGTFVEDVKTLENTLLIVDEAHNLFNSITNGSKNALDLYDLILRTNNIKIIFLSGTPVINHPFELVPCFNMLRGPIYYHVEGRKEPEIITLFSEDIEEFNSFFVQDYDEDKIAASTKDKSRPMSGDKSRPMSGDKSRPMSGDKSRPMSGDKPATHKDKSSRVNDDAKPISSKLDALATSTPALTAEHLRAHIKNKDKFTNRIFGLVSYYGDIYFEDTKSKDGFPEELPTIVERVPMSTKQFARYMLYRQLEQEESSSNFKGAKSRFSSSSGKFSTYRVKSRQTSNYAVPEYALGPVRGTKSREKFIDKITQEDLQNLDESPKMAKILENIKSFNHEPGIVYSQFVSGEGLAVFARVLEMHNYVNYSTMENEFGIDLTASTHVMQPVFAILSGDIPAEERQIIIDLFNMRKEATGGEDEDDAVENAPSTMDHGDIAQDVEVVPSIGTSDNLASSNKQRIKKKIRRRIELLLMSGAVAEGVDLKRVRHVHIMEPFWNYARINQVKTRAIRYESHIDLPQDQQNVQTYIYLSDYPKEFPKSRIKEKTTDVDLYDKSIKNMFLINTFFTALAEASIDCSLHWPNLAENVRGRIHCKMCAPDNKPLYHPIIKKDMLLPNNCQVYKESTIKVEEVVMGDGEKIYYKKDGEITIYRYNPKIKGYARIFVSDSKYADALEEILKKEKLIAE